MIPNDQLSSCSADGRLLGRERLLAVCIPTYNRSEYLEQCLAALVPQAAATGISICLSDNASTDNTAQVIAKYQARYSRIFSTRQRENLGFDKNHKAVIGMADTEFAWLLGDDDVVLDGAVEKVIRTLSGNPSCELLLLNAMLTDNNLRPKGRQFEVNGDVVLSDGNDVLRLYYDKLTFGMMVINARLFNRTDADRFMGTAHFYGGGVYEYLANNREKSHRNHILILQETMVLLRQGERKWSQVAGDISVRQIPEFFVRLHSHYRENARIAMKRAVGSYRTLLPLMRLRSEGWLDRERAHVLKKYYVDEYRYRLLIISKMPVFMATWFSTLGVFAARLLKAARRLSFVLDRKHSGER